MPALSVECPWPSQYGSSIAAVKFSATPSCMILIARRREAAAAVPLAPLDELGDLLEPARAVPPERADDARGQRAVGGRRR